MTELELGKILYALRKTFKKDGEDLFKKLLHILIQKKNKIILTNKTKQIKRQV